MQVNILVVKPKSAEKEFDLSEVVKLKLDFMVEGNDNGVHAIQEVELVVAGDSNKVSTIEQKILTFKDGSKMTLHQAILLDKNNSKIATVDLPDSFEVKSDKGIMERKYIAIMVKDRI